MVVGLHAGFLSDITSTGSYLSVNGVFRIAVPVFLLISGFFFYPVIKQDKCIQWVKRILFLYVFWMAFYSYFWFKPPEASLIGLIKLIKIISIGYHHLWFLPGMLGAAFLVLFFKKLPTTFMIVSILVTFISGVLIQYIGNYHISDNAIIDKWFNYHWVHRNFLFFGFPFFGLGFLIHKFDIHLKIDLRMALILSVIGGVFLMGESYINYIQPSRDGGFDNFISLLIVCPAIFLLVIKLELKGKSKELALYSTGVYFIHSLFLNIYRKFAYFDGTSLTFIVILSSIITSFFLIKINKRIKVIL